MGGKQPSNPDPVVEAFKNNYSVYECKKHDERFGDITLLRHKSTGELLALK